MRRWIILFVLVSAGCAANDSPITRAAGSYPGGFRIESVDGRSDPKEIAAMELRGNLELYVTHSKYKLDVAGANQKFSLAGTWKAEKSRVTLTTDSYSFDNPRPEDQKALNLKIVSPDDIRACFGHGLVLDLSADRRRLTGLKTSMGGLIGAFEFERPLPH